MHIVLKPSNRLPRSRPNLVVVKGVRLRFTKWQGDVMVFSSSRAQSVLHMITLKRGDVRRVDKILWKGEYLAQVDAYRVTQSASGRPLASAARPACTPL